MSFLSSYLFPSSLFSLILPLFVLVFLSFFPLLSLLSFVSIYRKTNGERVLLPLSGHGIGVGGGRAAIRQPPQGRPQSLFPLHFRLVVGHGLGFRQVGVFVRFVFGFWEREGEEKSKGTNASFPLSSARLWEEEDIWCRSKRHRFYFFFFPVIMHETTPCCPKRVVSFKWKLKPKRVRFQISPSIYVLFQFGPWFWISSIKSLIGHPTLIFMQLSP
jgi:hypothetical protein